jgi:hypothetical protein
MVSLSSAFSEILLVNVATEPIAHADQVARGLTNIELRFGWMWVVSLPTCWKSDWVGS